MKYTLDKDVIINGNSYRKGEVVDIPSELIDKINKEVVKKEPVKEVKPEIKEEGASAGKKKFKFSKKK